MSTHNAIICRGCWENLHLPVALRGPFSIPYRMVGLKPSRMNPNICTFCELAFTRIMKARKVTIDATVLFADLRGYTSASQVLPFDRMSAILDAFYDQCAEAIWAHDGLLNKTIGDAIMAVFNFPIQQDNHAAQAVRAARQIQTEWRDLRAGLVDGLDVEDATLRIGIGICSGKVSFGEFGQSHRDLTAIGTVVNTAARAQSVARAGQILVSQSVRDQCQGDLRCGEGLRFELKGLGAPIDLYDGSEPV